MSAFVVEFEHINALLTAGLNGATRGHGVGTVRWHTKTWAECRAEAETKGEDVMVTWQAAARELRLDTATETGQMLYRANVASVAHRYDEPETSRSLPGLDPTPQWAEYHFSRVPSINAVQALKALACYRYQSCERPDWESSEAAHCVEAMRHAFINMLPGYEDAPWEWTRRTSRPLTVVCKPDPSLAYPRA